MVPSGVVLGFNSGCGSLGISSLGVCLMGSGCGIVDFVFQVWIDTGCLVSSLQIRVAFSF